MTPLVVLDRDGVINEDRPDYVRTPAQWRPVPGALEGIRLLTEAGFAIAVATNQAGVAKGSIPRPVLDRIHEKMRHTVDQAGGRIDRVFVCPHAPADDCACRKPRPGLLLSACEAFGVAAAGVPFVGDSLRDLQAAEAAGCQPVLVLTGNGRDTAQLADLPGNLEVFDDLRAVARAFAQRTFGSHR